MLASILAVACAAPVRDRALEHYLRSGYCRDINVIWPAADIAADVRTPYLDACLRRLRQTRPDILRIRINEPIDEHAVNIYFLTADPYHLFMDWRDNCGTTGYKNIIICDWNYLHALQPSQLPTFDQYLPVIFASEYRAVVLWAIGHEIGHLAQHPTSAHAHFADDQTTVLIKNPDAHPASRKEWAVEEAADQFALAAFDRAVGMYAYRGLNHYINEEGNKLVQQQGYHGAFVEYRGRITLHATSQTHPPVFLRAVNMDRRLVDRFRFEWPNYYARIESQIVVVP